MWGRGIGGRRGRDVRRFLLSLQIELEAADILSPRPLHIYNIIMAHFTHQTAGTCSRQIDFDIDDEGKLHNVCFIGGCNGNLQGIGALVEGEDAARIASRIRGTRCGFKGTSCPDQLAQAIDNALAAGK